MEGATTISKESRVQENSKSGEPVCKVCGKPKAKHSSVNLCPQCYYQKYGKNKLCEGICKICGKPAKYNKKKLCHMCYRKEWIARPGIRDDQNSKSRRRWHTTEKLKPKALQKRRDYYISHRDKLCSNAYYKKYNGNGYIVLKEAEFQCTKCHYKRHPDILEIHHRDFDRKNNNKENLQVLCPNCHREIHYLSKQLYRRIKI